MDQPVVRMPIDPWRHVDADDDLVADLLAGTVEVVLECGGWLHPDARVVARGGELGIDCDAADGTPLVRVPAEAFVRIGRVAWTDSAERLEFEEVPDGFGAVETELLILQTALHNACGKVPRLVRTHPVLAGDLPDDVVDAVRAFRPSFRRRQPTPAGLLWSDRVLRLPGPNGEAPEPMALPLVDLLDHHHAGAVGTWTGDAFTVAVSRPTDGSCLLDYGLQRDAIGMAVVYGFADATCPVAHSAAVEVDVPGVGVVRVLDRGRARTGELVPPRVRHLAYTTTISRVTFGDDVDPVRDLALASSWSDEQCASVVDAVARRNTELLDALIDRTSVNSSPAAAILADAARRQRTLITR